MRGEEKPSKTYKTKRIRAGSTETETNEQELDLLAFRQEVLDGIDRIAGKGLIRDLEATDRLVRGGSMVQDGASFGGPNGTKPRTAFPPSL